MKVSVIGTGYVGLVTGVCLAKVGHQVICVDVDERKIESINRGKSPIYEQGLSELLSEVLGSHFVATTSLEDAVHRTEVSLIAVGTPFNGAEIDLAYVKQAASQVGNALREKPEYHVVAVKSTVVPGTTAEVVLPILEAQSGREAGQDFGVGMNPEFLREGQAVADFMQPDRIVLGGIDARTLDTLESLYARFESAAKIRTNTRTAEMMKYASNALLATLISFSNELANLCTASGNVDVSDVLRSVHLDRRLSPWTGTNGARIHPEVLSYLEAGCGFGGSCFPKDVKALIAHGQRTGAKTPILDAVIEINEAQPLQVLRLLRKHFSSLSNVKVAVLGLAFKPGTNDLRESPSIPVIRALLEEGALVRAYDPVATNEARAILTSDQILYCDSLSEAVGGAEAVALLTSWKEFESLPWILSSIPAPPVLVDGRRMLPKESVPIYEGIGL